MGTAVLRSHDCLKGRFPAETLISPPLKPRRNPNPNPNSNPTRSCRRKRSPSGIREKENRGSRCGSNAAKVPAKNLVMGQVTILKRGELLEPTEDRTSEVGEKEAKIGIAEVPVLCSTDRLGPEPEMIPKQIGLTDLKPGDGVFAGSGFFSSPPPSCLPFPAFFTKKIGPSKNDAATTDLRRLLRLDLP